VAGDGMGHVPPAVSIILPVLNEIDFVDHTLGDLLGQDYEGEIEIVVADGGSTDGTREKLGSWTRRDPRVVVIDNPERHQAFGLNRAAAAASHDVLIRTDGHTSYAPNYVRRSVEGVIELEAAIGGRMNPVGRTRFGRAVAAAMNSPLTMGPARFHHAGAREEVDTVYLGAFLREGFEAIGGVRHLPSGSSEDADFYYRWRRSGRRVFVDPAIVTEYTPRDRPGSLWRQYFRYGLGKAEMLWVNGRFPSPRPLAPAALVVGLILAVVLGFATDRWWPLVAGGGAWLALLAWVGVRSGEAAPTVMLAAGIMHLAYGLGTVWGLVRGPGPVRHLRRR
jgi:succinoglycan biosynthesis protein ExoA